MFKIFVILCLIACACCLPIEESYPQSRNEVVIVRDERSQNEDGSYSFVYETSDGQTREEIGQFIGGPDGHPELLVQGSFSYIRDDGSVYKVIYTADKNGYRPSEGLTINLGLIDKFAEITPPPAHLPPKAINSLLG